jgi:plasmid replication initiation protein
MNKILVVNQSNQLVTAQYSMSLLCKKVFAMAIAKLNPRGTVLTSSFNAKDLSSLLDSNDPNLPARILGAANDIMHIALTLQQDNKETVTRAFSQVTFDHSTKDIKVEFPSILREHLLDLQSQYSNYLLQNIVDLTNATHIRLFEILKSKAALKTWTFEIDELFYMMQLPASYRNYALLEQKFLLVAQKELNEHTGLSFTFERIKSGKKVVKLKFNIKYSEDKILDSNSLENCNSNQITIAPVAPKPIQEPKALEPQIQEIYQHYLSTFKLSESSYRLTPKRKDKIKLRLKDYDVASIKRAISNISKDPWEDRFKYRDIADHICHTVETVEKWLNFKAASEQSYSPGGRSIVMNTKGINPAPDIKANDNFMSFEEFWHKLPDVAKDGDKPDVNSHAYVLYTHAKRDPTKLKQFLG